MSPHETATLISTLAVAVRVCVGCVFIHAAVGKRRGGVFESVLAAYELLPRWAVRPAARLLPIAELALGVGLLAGVWSAGLMLASLTLLAAFAAAITVNLLRGRRHISCGCSFSGKDGVISYALVTRNLVLGALCLAGLVPAVDAGAYALIAASAGGALLFLVYLTINLVLELPPRRPGADRAAWMLS